MYLVAIVELAGAVDATLGPLAADLGTTVYELRLTLSAGLPAVVVATTEASRAANAVSAVARQGHRSVACQRQDVVASARMTALRDFHLEEAAIAPSATSAERLPYDDILAILRATHRTVTESTHEVTERKLRPGMAIATGGLVMSKKTKREITSKTDTREQVLYLFRRSGAPPWILRERNARYAGLGADLRPTSLENFATTTRLLRACAPGAVYDERLVASRPIRGVAEGIEASDILGHLIASDLGSNSTFLLGSTD
jgi:hypothetical protein